jgi:hypothetical protein
MLLFFTANAIRNNHNNSGYSNHILNTGHTYGTIKDTMDIIRKGHKGKHLNTTFIELVKIMYK